MPVIFQPERFFLENQIKKYASFIRGITIDVGGGQDQEIRCPF
jgi:hypothetical protein